MKNSIHSTAVIEEGAEIGKNVSIGAYSVIGSNVKIADNNKIHSHVIIDGHTTIGSGNEFFQFGSIGAPPQDLTYNNEPTETVIGNENVFREYVSIHRGTLKENKITKIGDKSLFMAHVHVGHDAIIGNSCVIVNSVNLAGHVKIGDKVVIGGGTNISQFVSIGRGSYIGGASGVDRDIPLFCTAYGNRAKLKGINIIGLRRHGYERQTVTDVVDFFRAMESSALSPRAFIDHEELMEDFKDNVIITEMTEAIKKSEVGIAPFVVS